MYFLVCKSSVDAPRVFITHTRTHPTRTLNVSHPAQVCQSNTKQQQMHNERYADDIPPTTPPLCGYWCVGVMRGRPRDRDDKGASNPDSDPAVSGRVGLSLARRSFTMASPSVPGNPGTVSIPASRVCTVGGAGRPCPGRACG